jgi:transposase-like protein
VIWQLVHRLADSVPDPPSAQPTRIAVDETAVKINGEWSWLYAAIDLDSKLLLGVDLFERRGTDPATEFLQQLTEKHDPSNAEFLVGGYGYLTVLFSIGPERSSGLRRPKSHRKVVSHPQNEC